MLREAGAVVAFSSDWPVAPLNPFQGIQAAMTARPLRADCRPQAQTLMDTLTSFTADGAAHVEFMEDRKGTLKEGYLADVIVLDVDSRRPRRTGSPRSGPVTTICDGRVTFDG